MFGVWRAQVWKSLVEPTSGTLPTHWDLEWGSSLETSLVLARISLPKTGFRGIFLYTKVDLASRFFQHPSVPKWHTLPWTLNFPAQGLICPSLEALCFCIWFLSPHPSFGAHFLSFSSPSPLCFPMVTSLTSFLRAIKLACPRATSQKPASASAYIYKNLVWIGSFYWLRNNLSKITVKKNSLFPCSATWHSL